MKAKQWQNPKQKVIINNSKFDINVSEDRKSVIVKMGNEDRTMELKDDEVGKYFKITTTKYYVMYKTKETVFKQLDRTEKEIEIICEKYKDQPIYENGQLNKLYDKAGYISKTINHIYKLTTVEKKQVDAWILSSDLFDEKYKNVV